MNIPQKYTITFCKKQIIAKETFLFMFNKPKDFTFTAGQFATVRIPSVVTIDNSANAVHALSFASAPSDEHIAFAWRSSQSAFKQAADILQAGDMIEMIAPAGHAVIPEKGHVIFLIGGIGITPVRSILRQMQFEQEQRMVTLFYSNRTPQDTPFFEEFSTYDKNICQIIHTMTGVSKEWTGETGFIDATMVRRHIDDYQNAIYYIVGTSGFVHAMEDVVAKLGVSQDKIICDNFG